MKYIAYRFCWKMACCMLTWLAACQSADTPPEAYHALAIDLVNPFIGTGGHGHTFPGATPPFGMVQLSPDNGTIKFEKLRLKLEAARAAGYDKAITFEFSHFMSPQSAYRQAGHLFNRYQAYIKTL